MLAAEDFDYVPAGARLLGQDVAAILSPDSKEAVINILNKETGQQQQYKLVEDMMKANRGWNTDFEQTLILLEKFKQGIIEGK